MFTVRHASHFTKLTRRVRRKETIPEWGRRRESERVEEEGKVERDANFLINFIESHTLFMIAEELIYRSLEEEEVRFYL
jgi:hypothetical protein